MKTQRDMHKTTADSTALFDFGQPDELGSVPSNTMFVRLFCGEKKCLFIPLPVKF